MNLIYTVSIGADFDKLLYCWYESIRLFGKFTGDVIVVTDHKINIDGVIEYRVSPGLNDFDDVVKLKFDLLDSIDFRSYENIMYLDVDHLAFNDINSLFCNSLKSMEEGVDERISLQRSVYHNGFLTAEEIKKDDGRSFCSGILCGPSDLFYKALLSWQLSYYSGTYLYENKKYKEQAAFNASIYRGNFNVDSYKKDEIAPPQTPPNFDKILIHFLGETKKWMIPTWINYKKRRKIRYVARKSI